MTDNLISVYKKIAQALTVINNPDAMDKYIEQEYLNLEWIQENVLPSGSGFDSGCKIDHIKSTPNKIVIRCDYHHMNENGYYDGWTYHEVIIKPCLAYDHDMKITGRDKRDIKNYILDVIYEAIEGKITNKSCYIERW
jgi:hypothetical protein